MKPLALILAIGIVISGCGLSTDDNPEPLASEALPDDLQRGGTTTTEPASDDADDVDPVDVFFLEGTGSDARLRPLPREVPQPADAAIVLEALFNQPPDEEEREAGITSAIPPDTAIDRTEVTGDVLLLDLPPSFYDQLEGDPSRNAFAQIVYTVTGLTNVRLVQFQLDGELVEAKDGEGEDRIGPLGRDDYSNLERRPTPTLPPLTRP